MKREIMKIVVRTYKGIEPMPKAFIIRFDAGERGC